MRKIYQSYHKSTSHITYCVFVLSIMLSGQFFYSDLPLQFGNIWFYLGKCPRIPFEEKFLEFSTLEYRLVMKLQINILHNLLGWNCWKFAKPGYCIVAGLVFYMRIRLTVCFHFIIVIIKSNEIHILFAFHLIYSIFLVVYLLAFIFGQWEE